MLDQIGLNHIFNLDTFCFCLLCKKNIPEIVNLNKEDIIRIHLESHEHASSCKALFKLCFPDTSCDSGDIRYLNILRNLAFDVSWEMGNESSYVCKSENSLKCLICDEKISKAFKDKKKLKCSLARHLQSELHLKEVKSKASWIHHPSEDVNYIAFHKFFVFCSYCQKYLKSPKNTLLQTAADHITIDLENRKQIKEREEQHDTVVEDLCLLFDFLSIFDETEICDQKEYQTYDVEINEGCKHFQYQRSEPNEIKDLDNSLQEESLDVESDEFVLGYNNIEPSELCSAETEKVKNTSGLQIIGVECFTTGLQRVLNQALLTDLVNQHSVLKLNKQYIEIRHNRFYCKLCKIFVQFDETIYKLKKHLFDDHNNLLVKRASYFILGRKRRKFSNVTTKNKESKKFCLVLEKIALDKKFASHVIFIENNGLDYVCTLCNENITFTTCGKYVEIHFFQTGHLTKTYEISVNIDLRENETDDNPKVRNKNKKSKLQTSQNVRELFFSSNSVKLQPLITKKAEKMKTKMPPKEDSQVTVMERRLMKILRLASEEQIEIGINLQFLTVQNGNVLCTACQEVIQFVNSGLSLFKHCISQSHNEILIKNATDYLVTNNLKPHRSKPVVLELILQKFYELLNEVTESDPYDVVFSHLLFLIVAESDVSTSPSLIPCTLCNELIEFTALAVLNHFYSNQHREKTFELNCKSSSDFDYKTEPSGNQPSEFEEMRSNTQHTSNNTQNNTRYFKSEQSTGSHINETSHSKPCNSCSDYNVILKNTLHKVAKKCIEVRVNEVFISCRTNNFFCNICQEMQIYSENGSFLKDHCLSMCHNETLLKNALNYVSSIKSNLLSSSKKDKMMLEKMLTEITNCQPFNIITSHVQFLRVKKGNVFCLLCRNEIGTSLGSKNTIKHFLSDFHRVKVYALNCSSYSAFTEEPGCNFKQLDIPKGNSPGIKPENIETSAAACAIDEEMNKRPSSAEETKAFQGKNSAESNQNNIKLLTLILEHLPEELKACIDMIELSEGAVHCKVCSFKFPLKRSLAKTSKLIQEHLPKHISSGYVSQKVDELIGTEAFESATTTIQQCIKKNIHLLQMRVNALYCCICEVTLYKREGSVFTDLNLIQYHFNGCIHKENLAAIQSKATKRRKKINK